ncbi:MAG: hypothetical protein IJM19_00240 [Ruminococcus sp.]|nr:hypothetical protein [Ruminococcus sp.]
MISSNITKNKTLPDRKGGFFAVSDSFEEYSQEIKKICPPYTGNGQSDHFLGTMRAIEKLWSEYSFEEIMDSVLKIQENKALKSWFALIICMIIHGRNNGNEIVTESFSTAEKPYLKIWKDKFIHENKDDNSINDNQQSDKFNVYKIKNKNSGSVVGCCSEKYFIIPPCEMIKDDSEWKISYFNFMETTIEKFFDSIKSPENKIKLILSAKSMPDKSPLKIVKDIINLYIRLKDNFPADIPSKNISGIKFYCTDGNNIPEKVLLNNIYITVADGERCALYPFTEKMAQDMEKCISSVKSIKMTVSEFYSAQAKKTITEAVKITSSVCYNIKLTGEAGEVKYIPYIFDERHIYDTEHIKNADNIGTFCMFPDIPLEYENRCKKYTYLYNMDSTVNGEGSPDDRDLKDTEYFSIPLGRRFHIRNIQKPEHLIKISLKDDDVSGYVLNLRKLGRDYLPFLMNNRTVEIDFSAKENKPDNIMYLYFDFGSSSSSFGYKINKGILRTDDVTGGTPVIRRLLSQYDENSYIDYMNFSTEKISNVPSANISLNGSEIENFFPYNLGFVPFSRKLTHFERKKLQIDASHKSDLMNDSVHESTVSIIYNMCYTAVCHAINMNCGKIILLPSFPNENYLSAYSRIWEKTENEIKNIFDIEIENLINCENKNLLYESIAISNGTEGVGNNILKVNIDIGDSTTDMSAVLTKDSHAYLCGYSSMNYAGRKLLKESFRSMISSIGMKNDIKTFREYVGKFLLGNGENHENPFIVPVDETEINAVVEEICNKFYPNQRKGGRPRNEQCWQNNFMEMLEYSDINCGRTNSADIKIKADMIMRYAVIMPVIKDFTETALAMCDSSENTAVNISFYGGGAKGLLLADKFTEGENSFLKRTNAYFRNFFGSLCIVDVPDTDAKVQLVKGLSKLNACPDKNDEYNIYPVDSETDFCVSWRDTDPSNIYSLNEIRRERCKKFGISEKDIYTPEPENYIPENTAEDFRLYAENIIKDFL